MKELLKKIEAVFANWHGHVDPVAAINQHLVDFAKKVHDEIEALKEGVPADVLETFEKKADAFFIRLEDGFREMTEALEKRIVHIESSIKVLEDKLPGAVATDAPVPQPGSQPNGPATSAPVGPETSAKVE